MSDNCRFVDRISKEFVKFQEDELRKSKEEIFRDNYKIRFYDEVSSFIADNIDEYMDDDVVESLDSEPYGVLDRLFDFYLDCDGASINTYEDTNNMITWYCEKYHRDDM